MNIKIPGVDPITLNRVQERTQKQVVQDAQKTKISEKEHRGREHRHPKDREELERAIKKLNNTVKALDKPIQFKLIEKQGKTAVQIIDIFRQRVVKEIEPAKVFEMFLKAEEILGILVDELI